MQKEFHLLICCIFIGVNGEKYLTQNGMPMPSALDSPVPCQYIRLFNAAPLLILRGVLSHNSEAAEVFF